MSAETPRAGGPDELHVGGALPRGAHYVQRAADQALFDALRSGRYCSVLAPRQTGKTSLRFRVAARLTEAGVRCGEVDLAFPGTSTEQVDRWYATLLAELVHSLDLPTALLTDFWRAREGIAGGQRFSLFVREVLLREIQAPLVVFVDEVNRLTTLPHRDDFLGSLRALHNQRAGEPALERLTFCLLGFARPEDLVKERVHNPFDIAQRIVLSDFTRAEAADFEARVGESDPERSRAIVDAIHARTSGHPYMTQALCRAVAQASPSTDGPERLVERCTVATFPRAGSHADSLVTAAGDFLLQDWSGAPSSRMLALYASLLDGNTMPARANDPVHTALWIGGVARDAGGTLAIRNAIYARSLDREWVREQLTRRPFQEDARAWEKSGREESALPRGEKLAAWRSWATQRGDLTEDELDFLYRAQLTEQRRASRRRAAWVAVVGVLGLFVGLGILVWRSRVSVREGELQGASAVWRRVQAKANDEKLRDLTVIEAKISQTRSALDGVVAARAGEQRNVSVLVDTLAPGADELEAAQQRLAQSDLEVARLRRQVDKLTEERHVAEQHASESLRLRDSPQAPAEAAPVMEQGPSPEEAAEDILAKLNTEIERRRTAETERDEARAALEKATVAFNTGFVRQTSALVRAERLPPDVVRLKAYVDGLCARDKAWRARTSDKTRWPPPTPYLKGVCLE